MTRLRICDADIGNEIVLVGVGTLCVGVSVFVLTAQAGICMLFFFQAEDGIRYLTVTGVQTCALPILSAEQVGRSGLLNPAAVQRLIADLLSGRRDYSLQLWSLLTLEAWHRMYIEDRSEERRVGKEGRSRWSPDH